MWNSLETAKATAITGTGLGEKVCKVSENNKFLSSKELQLEINRRENFLKNLNKNCQNMEPCSSHHFVTAANDKDTSSEVLASEQLILDYPDTDDRWRQQLLRLPDLSRDC